VPNLTDRKSFTVVVNDYLEITIGSAIASAESTTNSVPVDVFSSAGLQDLQVILAGPAEHVFDLSLEPMLPDLVTPSLEPSEGGNMLLSFATLPGQVLQGTQQVARLHFTAGSTSTFAPLKVLAASTTMDQPDLIPSLLANHGRVVVIGDKSLIESFITDTGRRQLIVYGKVGVRYTLQSSFGLDSQWSDRTSFIMTSPSRLQTPPSPVAPLIFYRLRE